MKKEPKYFDKTEIYESKIAPLVEELILQCNKERLPLFISIGVANSEKETIYKSDLLSPFTYGFSVTDDKSTEYLNVINGFKTYLPVGASAENDNDMHDILAEVEKDLNHGMDEKYEYDEE